MDTIRIIFAVLGISSLACAVASAVLTRRADGFGDGLFIGAFLGALGCLGVIYLIDVSG
jgi:hypothetical protein